MRIWAISDLHLSFDGAKPMDIFGPHWRRHPERVAAAWQDRVRPGDVVCLPGDLSWAVRLDQAGPELAWLGALPGRKVLVKGNHDYWWSSVSRVRQAVPDEVFVLQNDAVVLDGVGFAGARGWVDPALRFDGLTAPVEEDGGLHGIRGEAEDARIYRRELGRLEASLRRIPDSVDRRVALLHFPPTSPAVEETPVTRLLERYRVDHAVFGHLHAPAGGFRNPYGVRGGVTYWLASADFVAFAPVRIA